MNVCLFRGLGVQYCSKELFLEMKIVCCYSADICNMTVLMSCCHERTAHAIYVSRINTHAQVIKTTRMNKFDFPTGQPATETRRLLSNNSKINIFPAAFD